MWSRPSLVSEVSTRGPAHGGAGWESQMIVRRAGKYVVISETTGRRFGTYDTLAEAKRRLRQIEFFKHLKERTTAHGARRPDEMRRE